MTDLDDYHRLVGYLRAKGLDDAQAHHRADEAMEDPMTTFNITILRRSAMTISFQTDSYNEAVMKSAETITGWRHGYDPIERVFIGEVDKTIELLEYRPEEVVELATTRH
jgi:soluble cytochrome b562